MKIAQVAPLIESVPPRLYGGTERIVSYLTEELVAQGHDVTLFASADSITSAKLVPCCEQSLRLNPAVRDPIPYCMIMLDKLRRMASHFDILHFHIDQFHFPIFHDRSSCALTTLHGRQDLPDLKVLYDAFPDMPLGSIPGHHLRGDIGFDADRDDSWFHRRGADWLRPGAPNGWKKRSNGVPSNGDVISSRKRRVRAFSSVLTAMSSPIITWSPMRCSFRL